MKMLMRHWQKYKFSWYILGTMRLICVQILQLFDYIICLWSFFAFRVSTELVVDVLYRTDITMAKRQFD